MSTPLDISAIEKAYTDFKNNLEKDNIKLSDEQLQSVEDFIEQFKNTIKTVEEKCEEKCEEELSEKIKEAFETYLVNQEEYMTLHEKISNLLLTQTVTEKAKDTFTNYISDYLTEFTTAQAEKENANLEKYEEAVTHLNECKEQIEKLKKENKILTGALQKESVAKEKFKKAVDRIIAVRFLEAKTENLPPVERKYVKSVLQNASVDTIKKEFSNVVKEAVQHMKKHQVPVLNENTSNTETLEKTTKQKLHTPVVPLPESVLTKNIKQFSNNSQPENTSSFGDEDITDDTISESAITSDMMQSWVNTVRLITPQK